MKAFHNKLSVKKSYLARVKAHALADEIVKGKYWEEGKGCAVGCTIHSSNHSAYERELGLPTWLARVEDRLFEGMPLNEAKKWPTQFLSAVNVGSDLEKIKRPFLIVVLKFSLKQFDHKKSSQAATAIEAVIKLLKSKKEVSTEQWQEARRNATSAAAYAAYAADNAAYAADNAAARSSAYSYFATELLKLVRRCKK